MTSACFLLGALFLLCSVTFEIKETRNRYLWLIYEGILAILTVFLFPVVGLYFIVIVLLDFIEDRSGYLYYVCYGVLIPAYYFDLNVSNYFLVVSFLILIYLQHQKIIGWYKQIVGENQQMESRLKSDMEQSNIAHKDELKQSRLQHENALLEEKARISQALLDECEEQYNINTSLKLEQADKEIPENIWEIILDNAFEAFTNSLKYSGCTEIDIQIIVLAEVVRCTFDDDELVDKAIKNGAKGYLIKNHKPDELKQMIKSIHQGVHVMDEQVFDKFVEDY